MYGETRARRTLYFALLVALVGLGWGLWGLYRTPVFRYLPLLGVLAPRPTATLPPAAATLPPTPGSPTPEQVIALVQGYNQADTVANRTSDLSSLLPYLHPDGPLYARLATEYRRRIGAGEVHNAALTRFFAATPRIGADEVTLETQEIWDETAVDRAGQVLWSQVGMTTRQVYTIRRDAAGIWRIWDLTTTVEESRP